mmetsp:Transcript_18956/g.66165  ORF Transcript_18956/g.66165 Transcript_18956/m.66165 type:complete len:433 (+) Transcript_18956:220-1518(+)
MWSVQAPLRGRLSTRDWKQQKTNSGILGYQQQHKKRSDLRLTTATTAPAGPGPHSSELAQRFPPLARQLSEAALRRGGELVDGEEGALALGARDLEEASLEVVDDVRGARAQLQPLLEVGGCGVPLVALVGALVRLGGLAVRRIRQGGALRATAQLLQRLLLRDRWAPALCQRRLRLLARLLAGRSLVLGTRGASPLLLRRRRVLRGPRRRRGGALAALLGRLGGRLLGRGLGGSHRRLFGGDCWCLLLGRLSLLLLLQLRQRGAARLRDDLLEPLAHLAQPVRVQGFSEGAGGHALVVELRAVLLLLHALDGQHQPAGGTLQEGHHHLEAFCVRLAGHLEADERSLGREVLIILRRLDAPRSFYGLMYLLLGQPTDHGLLLLRPRPEPKRVPLGARRRFLGHIAVAQRRREKRLHVNQRFGIWDPDANIHE